MSAQRASGMGRATVVVVLLLASCDAFKLRSTPSLVVNRIDILGSGGVLRPEGGAQVHTQKPAQTDTQTTRRSLRSTALGAIKGPVRYTSTDWFDCMLTLPTSRILRRVRSSIMVLALWTWALTYYSKKVWMWVALPSVVHSVLGSALGLLLVFRTNTSYERFWDARKQWSTVLAKSRDCGRDMHIHIDKKHHYPIACLLIAYAISLKQHLQGESVASELDPYLADLPLECQSAKVETYRNRPEYILKLLATRVHRALREKYPDGVEATLHEKDFHACWSQLTCAAANCERIVKQPVPLSYSRHASRFLTLYIMTLPLSLIPQMGWYSVPTMVFIGWSFLSIQEIGHFIEDPFNRNLGILPLNQFISVLRSDISEMLDGVIDSPSFARLDEEMMKNLKGLARMQDDAFFEYY